MELDLNIWGNQRQNILADHWQIDNDLKFKKKPINYILWLKNRNILFQKAKERFTDKEQTEIDI